MGSEQTSEIDSRRAFASTSWHVLADDKCTFAIALQEPSTGISLVLAMRRPFGSREWTTKTSDGSLEAWLHRSFVKGRQLVDFDELDEFWRQRATPSNQAVITLNGSASVKMDASLPKSIRVDLRSLEPVPLYRAYFEQAYSPSNPPEGWLRGRLATPDSSYATIRGEFSGRWIDVSWRPPI
jgi:hypothetical protein